MYCNSLTYAGIVYYLNLIYWQQVTSFKSLNLEQITSKYSERLYLCLNNYYCNLNSKFNRWFHSLNVIECTSISIYQCYIIVVTNLPLWKDSEGLYLCLNSYHWNMNSKFNHLLHSWINMRMLQHYWIYTRMSIYQCYILFVTNLPV